MTRQEVISAVQSGEIIETYTDDKPFLSCLIYSGVLEPLHVVLAIDPGSGICHIVTAYRPDNSHFEDDLKTRRE